MPKMKTRSSVGKRFTFTGNGKVRYKQRGVRHLLTKKRTTRKRRLRGVAVLSKSDSQRVQTMIRGTR